MPLPLDPADQKHLFGFFGLLWDKPVINVQWLNISKLSLNNDILSRNLTLYSGHVRKTSKGKSSKFGMLQIKLYLFLWDFAMIMENILRKKQNTKFVHNKKRMKSIIIAPLSILEYPRIQSDIYASHRTLDGRTSWKRVRRSLIGSISWPTLYQKKCSFLIFLPRLVFHVSISNTILLSLSC